MANDNALSFVGKIMTAYKAAEKARGTGLKHAIECGEYLNLAKENLKEVKSKQKWSSWLKEHCPEIHQNTAALYMRLAEKKDKIADCKSIRDADMQLRKPRDPKPESHSDKPNSDEAVDDAGDDEDADDDEAADDDDADNSQRVVKRAGASPDLKECLQNVDVDEVFGALTSTWERAQLSALVTRLFAYIRELDKPPSSVSVERRPLAPPSLS